MIFALLHNDNFTSLCTTPSPLHHRYNSVYPTPPTMSFKDYVYQVKRALATSDSRLLKDLLTINPDKSQGMVRAQFPEPNDFDLYIIEDGFKGVIKAYLKLMKSIYIINDIKLSFNDYNEVVTHLNRYATNQTNWINYPLMTCCKELVSIFEIMSKNFPEVMKVDNGEQQEIASLSSSNVSLIEKLATTINNSFKLSLNDKNLDLSLSKRVDIYFFLSHLIKIYFKLGNIELAKSLEKALIGTRFPLPELDRLLIDKASAITYLYYSAILLLIEENYSGCYDKLTIALSLMSYYSDINGIHKQLEKIWLIYLPVNLLLFNRLPKSKVWEQFPNLSLIYRNGIFKAIVSGNIHDYNHYGLKYQKLFLNRHLYMLIAKLKQLCYVNLIKKCVKYHQQLSSSPENNHIVPLSGFSVGFKVSGGHQYNDPDHVECIVANLIAKGDVKGYISHTNQCIVLSKRGGFR